MEPPPPPARLSRKMLWTGRTISGLAALFLLFDAVAKLVQPPPVVEGTMTLGFRESVILQTIGPDGMRFATFLTTMFFFIFFTNIFEIIPGMQFPANARTAVPIILAVTVWCIYNYVGISKQGFGAYLKGVAVPPGVPKARVVRMLPVSSTQLPLMRSRASGQPLSQRTVARIFALVVGVVGVKRKGAPSV